MKKYLPLLAICLLLISCREPIVVIDSEYFLWGQLDSLNWRTYECRTDSGVTRFRLSQFAQRPNDSTLEISYAMYRSDSLPVNRSIERYTNSGKFEMVEHAFFETDSAESVKEVLGHFVSQNSYSDLSQPLVIKVEYKFRSDTSLTITRIDSLKFVFNQVDGSDEDCLIAETSGRTIYHYSGSRSATTIDGKSKRVFKKGVGLIRFSELLGEKEFVFELGD